MEHQFCVLKKCCALKIKYDYVTLFLNKNKDSISCMKIEFILIRISVNQ